VLRSRPLQHLTLAAIVIGCLISTGAPLVGRVTSEKVGRIRPARRQRPDIVLITIDALRADHLSTYGYPRLTSPSIDRFAKGSVLFTNAITQAPYTKAAIASLMTGMYPSVHKTVTATVPFSEAMSGHPTTAATSTDVLPSDLTTLAEALQGSGYQTLGFTANPFLIEPFGFAQGFDVYQFMPGAEFATADRLVDDGLAAVRRSGPGPVFLWMHLMEPHSPYAPPHWADDMFALEGPPHLIPPTTSVPPWLMAGTPRDLRLYERNYDEEIAAADAAVDTLLREFAVLRDASNTVTVLTADHGEQFLDHGGFEHNDTLYDELIHVPLIISAPRTQAAVVNVQVELLDLYRTILTFADADAPDVSGRDLQRLMVGTAASRPAFSENYGAQTAVRTDDWKFIHYTDGREELFDLRLDRHEQNNVIAGQPERAAQLRSMLDGHAADSADRGRAIRSARTPVSPRVLERLRALGYVGR
jgi:arylsulfatase A-like enzyme